MKKLKLRNFLKGKIFKKIVASIFLVFVAYACFVFPKKEIRTFVQYQNLNQTLSVENDGLKTFLSYIGLFSLIMAVWIWRKELKVSQIGFIGDDGFSNFDPETIKRGISVEDRFGRGKPIEDGNTIRLNDDSDSRIDFEYNSFLKNEKEKHIISFMKTKPGNLVTATMIANSIRVSKHTAELYLFSLMKRNIVRRDAFPGAGSVVYSLVNSIENKAIDDFKEKWIRAVIIADYRYLSYKAGLKKFILDALVKTTEMNYVIEVKHSLKNGTLNIDNWINQLLVYEKEIKLEPVKLVLIIATNKEMPPEEIDQYKHIENLIIHFFNAKG